MANSHRLNKGNILYPPPWTSLVSLTVACLGIVTTLAIFVFTKFKQYEYAHLVIGIIIGTFLLQLISAIGLWLYSSRWPKRLGSVIVDGIYTLSMTEERGNMTTIKALLEAFKDMIPESRCKKQSDRIEQSFEYFEKSITNNSNCAWLLPPACYSMLQKADHYKKYMEMQFLEWSWIVVGNQEIKKGLLDRTKYLFITWDLSDDKKWDKELFENLRPMLDEIGKKTRENALIVNRFIIIDWLKMRNNNDIIIKFVTQIWDEFFGKYTIPLNNSYKINFVDITALKDELVTENNVTDFCDVALFSFSENIRNQAETTVLPDPGQIRENEEYGALQFSRGNNSDNLINLFIMQGRANYPYGWEGSDELIERMRKKISDMYYDDIQFLPRIDDEVKRRFGIDYVTF